MADDSSHEIKPPDVCLPSGIAACHLRNKGRAVNTSQNVHAEATQRDGLSFRKASHVSLTLLYKDITSKRLSHADWPMCTSPAPLCACLLAMHH